MRGSHRQYRHPSKPGRVTVAGKPPDDVAPGTLGSIFKQAALQIRFHVDGLREHGLPVPAPTSLAEYVDA